MKVQRVEQPLYIPYQAINELAVWKELLGYYPVLGNSQVNTLRGDKNPGSVYFSEHKGRLVMSDFADLETFCRMPCNIAYQYKYGQPFKDYIEWVRKNKLYDTKAVPTHSITRREKKEFRPIYKKFTSAEIQYWSDLGVDGRFTKDLLYSAKGAIVNGTSYSFTGLAFVYKFRSGKTQIYRPFESKYKFMQSATKYDMFGYFDLPYYGDKLLITKSGKDFLCLKSLIARHNLNYHVVATTSEGILHPYFVRQFKNRFKKIVLLFDNDQVGIKNMHMFHKLYNLDFHILDSVYKDSADIYKYQGETVLLNQICRI